MIETEEISEMLILNSTLTLLIAREDFSVFIRRESFKSYTPVWRRVRIPPS
jgi:hypothetical protein